VDSIGDNGVNAMVSELVNFTEVHVPLVRGIICSFGQHAQHAFAQLFRKFDQSLLLRSQFISAIQKRDHSFQVGLVCWYKHS